MRPIKRLRQMSLDEVVCRGRQQAWRWIDTLSPVFDPMGEPRRARRRTRATAQDPDAVLRHFLEAAPRRFFAGAEDALLAADWNEGNSRAASSILAEADRVMDGRFALLGYRDVWFGDPIDWHLDPLSGRRAPTKHWSRIDPLDAVMVGDSKVIWEVNRHQWMVTLAQAARLTGQQRYAEAVLQRLEHWTLSNPYPIGINWSSSLEVSLRLIAWCWTLLLIRDSPALTPERFVRWRTLACAHAAHVERYLSYYYSPNTHLTGEALGLVYAGVVFAEHPDAARWRDVGCRVLVQELDRQIEADGTHFERATCYQRYTVEIYLHLLVLGERNRLRLPPHVRERTRRMVQFLTALQSPDGMMPDVGDADGGWLLPLTQRAPGDCRATLALAASVLDDAEAAWAAGPTPPELFWQVGHHGVESFERMHPRPPLVDGSQLFESGGYAVMRSGWEPDAHQLIVDVGPLGCPVSSAHGHADLLSVQCVAFGERYLVDPGTYCYTADATLRNHFRGTRAHNTVTVDGLNQAEPGGPFSWQSRPSVTFRAWESTGAHDLVEASHDGYLRLAGGVEHRRRVVFVKPHGWVIVDDLVGTGTHDFEIRYQFSPRSVSRCEGDWIRAEGRDGHGLWLAVMSGVAGVTEIREGQRDPLDGWVSSAYGTMQPAPVVVWHARATCPVRVATLILPAASLQAVPPQVAVGRTPDRDVRSVRMPGGVVRISAEALFVERSTDRERIA